MWEPDPGWHALPRGAGVSTVGVWRTAYGDQPVVIKRLGAPERDDPAELSDRHHFAYWRREADVLVFGHSHIPWDTTTPRGLRLLNPGSPTDRRRQPHCTYLTLTAADGALSEVRLHRLPPRVQ